MSYENGAAPPGFGGQAPLARSLELLARGQAHAVTSAAAVVHYRTVIIDGTIATVMLQQSPIGVDRQI